MPNLFVFLFMLTFLNSTKLFASIAPAKPLVVVSEVKRAEYADKIQYPARVKSNINAQVVAEVTGEVRDILKPIGAKVKKGEVVLIIKNPDPLYHYAPIRVRAPISGIISSYDVALLSRVERGENLFLITDPNDLMLEVEIPAADLKYFQIGSIGEALDINGAKNSVRITALSPIVDIKTGTAKAELALSKSESPQLTQGQILQIHFETNKRSSIILSESAIVFRQGKTYVRVVSNNKAVLAPVEILKNIGDKVEISKGLSDGDRVITQWNRFISENEEVQIQESKKAEL